METKVEVLYFGAAKEIAGVASEVIDAGDTASLMKILADKYPGIGRLPLRLAVNSVLAREDCSLKSGDRVALLPPFAGG